MRPLRKQPGITYTLIFLKQNTNILLGLKKRGFGKGKWNGFGGKVEPHETILDGALREMKEESNLTVHNLNPIGILAYEEQLKGTIDYVHVYTTHEYSDTLIETDEMKPEWFKMEQIPFEQMWPDSKYWFPFMLKEKYFFAHVIYDLGDKYQTSIVRGYESFDPVFNQYKDESFLNNDR